MSGGYGQDDNSQQMTGYGDPADDVAMDEKKPRFHIFIKLDDEAKTEG